MPATSASNISSDAAVKAYPNWGAYGAAKAASPPHDRDPGGADRLETHLGLGGARVDTRYREARGSRTAIMTIAAGAKRKSDLSRARIRFPTA